jgi:uncharacterized delta-60 repeat protein
MAVNLAPTFKVGTGRTILDIGVVDTSQIISIQSDGKILVAGSTQKLNVDNIDVALIRYNKDGTLDTSFGNQGQLTTDLFSSNDIVSAVTQQQDGKIIVATKGVVARYNTDGSLDTSFDNDGKFVAFIGQTSTVINDVAVQANGKLLLAGQDGINNNAQIRLQRLNGDGTVDNTFGINGQNSPQPGNVREVTIQPDGKIVVLGNAGDNLKYFVARYNADGSLDTSFNGTGRVESSKSVGIQQADYGYSLTMQADGKIAVASSYYNLTGQYECCIARYNNDGSLDTSFSGDGLLTLPISQFNSMPTITAIENGKLLVTGFFPSGTFNTELNFSIIRLNADGSLDTSFSGDGIATIAGYSNSSIKIQDDGKMLASFNPGYNPNPPFTETSFDFGLVRFNSDGSLDTHFNPTIDTLNNTPNYIKNATPILLDNTVQIYDAELTALNSGNGNYSGSSVTLARQGGASAQDVFSGSGNLSLSGSSVILSGVTIGSLTNTNGTLAITFNANATQVRVNEALSLIAYSNTSDAPPASVQINWAFNDGNTGVQGTGGALSTLGSTTVNIAAVNDAPTFALTEGYVFTSFPFVGINSRSSSEAVSLQSNGKILVAGSDGYNLSLVRYNSNGTLDTSFDVDGKVTTNFGNFGPAYVGISKCITVQPDGKILIAGTAGSIARYNTDGSLDTTFSGDGKVLDSLLPQGIIESILVQPDGKILISGGIFVGISGNNYNVARYNSDGTLDTTFGISGLASTYISFADIVSETVLQADGKILVVGTSLVGGASRDFTLVRYNANGTLDTSFDGDGKLTTAVGALDDYANSVALQTDGKIVVGGTSDFNFALARYNVNGSLDTSFSGDGKLTLDLGESDTITAVAIQADGKILAAGNIYFNFDSRQDVALVRYNADGTLDSSFANNGKLITNFGADNSYISDIVVQPDGKIVVSGGNGNSIVVVRYNANGSIDTSFDDPSNNINESTVNNTSLYNENGPSVILDSTVSIYDAELAALNSGLGNYSGATVTLTRQGGANTQDIFSSSGNLSFAGGNAILSGVIIGSVSNGNGGLTITFNGSATQARVNETLKAIAYSNSSDAPPANVHINWSFNDGNAGAQGIGGALTALGTTTVNINAANDAPVLNTLIPDLNATTGITFSYTLASNAFTDIDGDTLTYSATLANGNPLPSWLVFNPITHTFSGTPIAGNVGSMTIRVYAADPTLATVFDEFVITTVGSGLIGTSGNDTLTGTSGDDMLQGLAGNDVLNSLAGNDTLDGGTGADTMQGGAGSDTYVVDNIGDVITEGPNTSPAVVGQGNYSSFTPSVSADGRYVSFQGYSEFNFGNNVLATDVFVKDMQTGLLIKANDYSEAFANEISSDGRYLLYMTSAAMAGDTNNVRDIYLKDLQTGTTTIVTTNSAGQLGNADPLGDLARISTDNTHVSFTSYATNLVVNDTNNLVDVFVKNLITGATTLVSSNSAGVQANTGGAVSSISANGRYVSFHSDATNLSAADTNANFDVYLKDTTTGITTLVSSSASGIVGNGLSWYGSISADGNFVAFESDSTNLVSDSNFSTDIFVKNITTGAIQRVSTSSTGLESNGLSQNVSFSADGRYVVFESAASNLVANDTNGSFDVFVKDLQTGAIQRVSTNSSNQQIFGGSGQASISDNGRYVVFESDASNLIVGDTNNVTDIFIKDLLTGEVRIASSQSIPVQTSTETNAVLSSISYSLVGRNLNNLTLTGVAAINGTGNALNNSLTGNNAANLLIGGDGNDTLDGSAGNDTLGGGAGNDILNGGEGTDVYTVGDAAYKSQAEINDTGLLGIDELRFASALAGTTLTVYAGDTGLETVVIGTGLAAVADITGSIALNVNASAATNALSITGNAGANSITGGAGNDTLRGDAGNDTLIGGEGNDSLRSGLGSDVLNGGNGDDAYFIDVSTDVIEADSSGIDTVNVYYATGTYTLAADLEHINLFGTTAINGTGNALNNTIVGNTSDNIIDGGDGNDLLRGDAGNDSLTGGLGNDTLGGGLGNDTLAGGDGNDFLYGSVGQDTFDFNLITESLVGASRDTIIDFSAIQLDKIDLAGIDANTNLANDQAFSFIGSGVFTGVAGQLNFIGGILSGDVNGDSVADFEIALTGVASLAASDFIL